MFHFRLGPYEMTINVLGLEVQLMHAKADRQRHLMAMHQIFGMNTQAHWTGLVVQSQGILVCPLSPDVFIEGCMLRGEANGRMRLIAEAALRGQISVEKL